MKFKNREVTKMSSGKNPHSSILKSYMKRQKNKNPKLVETTKIELNDLKNNSVALLGHSTVLLNVDNKIILTDPVIHGKPVGPFNLFGVKPFKFKNNYTLNELPEKIDVVIISHNHYDHLDLKTIKLLNNSVDKFFIPIGTKKLLIKAGVEEHKITEFSWEDRVRVGELEFTYLESRHFTGRGLFDRNKTPWGSWLIQSQDKKIFFTGDTGYTKLFKEYGEKFDGIDLGLIECGAYSKYWSDIHMLPEQSVSASIDLKVKHTIPIHNRKYDLALHHWLEPIKRFKNEADNKNLNYTIPNIGEIINF